MKIYCAKVNTGSPETGFISVGEVLSEKQVAALGEQKLSELVRAGVLAECGEEKTPVSPRGAAESGGADPKVKTVEPIRPDPESDDGDGEEPESEELPTLELADELVNDSASEQTPPPKPAKRKGGKK